MTVAVLTSGGDAPGMSGVVRGVARAALVRGWEVLGVRAGYQGLLEGLARRLDGRPLPSELYQLAGTLSGLWSEAARRCDEKEAATWTSC